MLILNGSYFLPYFAVGVILFWASLDQHYAIAILTIFAVHSRVFLVETAIKQIDIKYISLSGLRKFGWLKILIVFCTYMKFEYLTASCSFIVYSERLNILSHHTLWVSEIHSMPAPAYHLNDRLS